MVAMEEDHPVPPEEVQAVVVLLWEAQEVDVHPLEVLEADHQEVGLEIVQEAQVRKNSVYQSFNLSVN